MTAKNVYLGPTIINTYNDDATYADDGSAVRGVRTEGPLRVDTAPTASTDVVRLTDLQAQVIANASILVGPYSGIPTASAANAGKFYFASDQSVFYYSDGTSWGTVTLTNLLVGTLAGRPASSSSGVFYFASDKLAMTYYTGTAWVTLGSVQWGTNANIPAAGMAGRFYYAYDQFIMYFDNGTSWQFVSAILVPTEANKLGAANNYGLVQITIDTLRLLVSDNSSYLNIGLIIYQTLANRPAAAYAGRYFHATDTNEFFYDNGTSWQTVAGPRRVSVASISNPTELASYKGNVVGELIYVVDSAAKVTLYAWGTSATINSPYVVTGNGGRWVAVAGVYSYASNAPLYDTVKIQTAPVTDPVQFSKRRTVSLGIADDSNHDIVISETLASASSPTHPALVAVTADIVISEQGGANRRYTRLAGLFDSAAQIGSTATLANISDGSGGSYTISLVLTATPTVAVRVNRNSVTSDQLSVTISTTETYTADVEA